MRTYVCAVLLVLLPIALQAQASRDSKRAFESAYKNRTVVLKQTLYSIAATVAIGTAPEVWTRGSLMLTPDKGAYHSALFGQKFLRDRDPQQLLEKGAAETQLISAGGPKLLRYQPGTKMRMQAVLHDDAVRVTLYDELADGEDETTSIEIQWPQKFSRSFTERSSVEQMLAEYLEMH